MNAYPQTVSSASSFNIGAQQATQLSSGIIDLQASIADLEQSLTAHVKKLEPVLMPSTPQDVSKNPDAHQMLCPAADRIRSATINVQRIALNLREITERTQA